MPRKEQRAEEEGLKISEKEFQKGVIKTAQYCGWIVAHFRPSLNQRGTWQTAVAGNGAGFPDLVLCHERTHEVIFAELKAEKGKVSPEQQRWLDALGGVVWRPSNWPKIEARLKRANTKGNVLIPWDEL
jgi:hypothetical protein